MTHAIPHIDVYCLTSSEEADVLLSKALDQFAEKRKQGETPRSQIFFLGRENFPRRFLPEESSYQLGKAQILLDNAESFTQAITIAATGPLIVQALNAAEKLAQVGVGTIVVNPSIINRPDVDTFVSCLQKTEGRLLTVEDHQRVGGMAAVLTHSLLQSGLSNLKLKSLAVNDCFGQSAYQAIKLYQKHGLDAERIAHVSQSLLQC